MLKSFVIKILVLTPVIVVLAGCANAPGNRQTQGAVIGGAAGAAAGSAVAKNNRVLGAIIGGVLGAGGGYVIAAKTDKVKNQDTEAATTATRKSQENPATAADAQKAMSADLNNDGFVTLDEVVAMRSAGFSDEQMISRMQTTDQVFELTADQEKYLMDHGVSKNVVNRMSQINQDQRQQLLNERQDVISRPQSTP